MLKQPPLQHFLFRSDSEKSNATPTQGLSGAWLSNKTSASEGELKEAAPSKVDKEIEISRDGDKFGLFKRFFQHCP
jgi:hypothetical protein